MSFYLFSTFHAWNSRLVPVFGFPLNALLFWLVWTKTPKEMRLHSRILLQTCCVDLIFLTVNLIVIPVLVTVNHASISVFLLDGYFTRVFTSIFNSDQKICLALTFISLMCYFFDVFSISVQFVYRYLLLDRDMRINLVTYLLMLGLPLVVSFVLVISFFLDVAHEEFTDELKVSLNVYVDWETSIYLVCKQTKWAFAYFLAMIISYSINFVCGIKVVKFVGAYSGFNPRMKEMNQQLTKSLIFLALFPLCNFLYTLIYSAVSVALMITGSELVATVILFVGYFFTSLFVWLPVVNPLVSIWINRPYRDAIIKFIANKFGRNNSVTPIQPLHQQNCLS